MLGSFLGHIVDIRLWQSYYGTDNRNRDHRFFALSRLNLRLSPWLSEIAPSIIAAIGPQAAFGLINATQASSGNCSR